MICIIRISAAALMLCCIFNPAKSLAGTFYAGVKGWYASWESAASQIMDEIVADIMTNEVEPEIEPLLGDISYTTSTESGAGYLGGPAFVYETENRKWLFEIELLFINNFSQQVEVAGRAGSLRDEKKIDIDVDRKDYRLNACYRISRYFNVFMGYRYEIYRLKCDINLPYDFGLDPDLFKYDYESRIHVVTAGAGAAYPIDENENYVVGVNLGTMWGFVNFKDNVRGEDIEVKGKYAVQGEACASAKIAERLFVRLGYGFERYKGEVYIKERNIRSDAVEMFYGINGACMYIF